MICCSCHQGKVGVGGMGLQATSGSRWGRSSNTALSLQALPQAQAPAVVITCPSWACTKLLRLKGEAQLPECSSAGLGGRGSGFWLQLWPQRAVGLKLGSCTLWTSVSPAAHTGWTHLGLLPVQTPRVLV